jgi:hypothetical protein
MYHPESIGEHERIRRKKYLISCFRDYISYFVRKSQNSDHEILNHFSIRTHDGFQKIFKKSSATPGQIYVAGVEGV